MKFRKVTVHQRYYAENATMGDYDGDGVTDIASGNFWYRGPGFSVKHKFFADDAPGEAGFDARSSSSHWQLFSFDFNEDGHLDIAYRARPAGKAAWFENPGNAAGSWRQHAIAGSVGMEQVIMEDLDGDGTPELFGGVGGAHHTATGTLGFWQRDAGASTWRFRAVARNGPYYPYFHGIGVGDIDGDGKMDLLERSGWWQQGAAGAAWKLHVQPFYAPGFGPNVRPEDDPFKLIHDNQGGAEMYTYDVDGDGDADVVTSLNSHGWGLAWFEQYREGGNIRFRPHYIMKSDKDRADYGAAFSQLHALHLVDMDGDGLRDIVTGKSFWAHRPGGPDPDIEGTPYVHVFRLSRAGGTVRFEPVMVDDKTGVGRQFAVGDVTGDGKPDIIVGNRKGVFVYVNESTFPELHPDGGAGGADGMGAAAGSAGGGNAGNAGDQDNEPSLTDAAAEALAGARGDGEGGDGEGGGNAGGHGGDETVGGRLEDAASPGGCTLAPGDGDGAAALVMFVSWWLGRRRRQRASSSPASA